MAPNPETFCQVHTLKLNKMRNWLSLLVNEHQTSWSSILLKWAMKIKKRTERLPICFSSFSMQKEDWACYLALTALWFVVTSSDQGCVQLMWFALYMQISELGCHLLITCYRNYILQCWEMYNTNMLSNQRSWMAHGLYVAEDSRCDVWLHIHVGDHRGEIWAASSLKAGKLQTADRLSCCETLQPLTILFHIPRMARITVGRGPTFLAAMGMVSPPWR